jgi:hypothetical protein
MPLVKEKCSGLVDALQKRKGYGIATGNYVSRLCEMDRNGPTDMATLSDVRVAQ